MEGCGIRQANNTGKCNTSVMLMMMQSGVEFIRFQLLENRTKASCQEMEMLETLEELRELRHRHAKADPELMIQQAQEDSKKILQQQEEEDEEFVR